MKKSSIGTIAACIALFTTAFGQTPDTLRVDRTDKTYIEEHTTSYDTIKKDTSSDLNANTYTVPATPPNYNNNDQPTLKDPPPLHRGEFGIRYMPLFTSLDLHTNNGSVATGHVTMTHGFGAMIGLNFDRHVGLQLEANYYQATQDITDQTNNQTYNVNMGYLNFPLLLTLNTDKRRAVNLNIVGGPQLGFNVNSSVKTTGNGESTNVNATVSKGNNDLGVAYGAGLEIALNRMHTVRLDLGYRGFYGLVDFNAKQTSSTGNSASYNIFVRGSRQANGAYLGLRFAF